MRDLSWRQILKYTIFLVTFLKNGIFCTNDRADLVKILSIAVILFYWPTMNCKNLKIVVIRLPAFPVYL